MIACTTAETLIPCPLSRVEGFKLMAIAFASMGRLGRIRPDLGFFLEILVDGASHAQHLRTWHLQDHIPGAIEILDHDLPIGLTIALHLHFIFWNLSGGSGLRRRSHFLFWGSSRNGLGISFDRRGGPRPTQIGFGSLRRPSRVDGCYRMDAHIEIRKNCGGSGCPPPPRT